MKYLVVLTDGAAGRPMDEIGGKTALEAANMDCVNSLAVHGEAVSYTHLFHRAEGRILPLLGYFVAER